MTLVQGEDGNASRLSYDLTAGGNYVSATLDFTKALSTQSIAFWVREPARSQAKLRMVDAQGQVFEYSIPRPLEAFAPGMWFRSIVDVQAFTGFFGGPDDGKLRMPLSGLSILAIPEFETVGAEIGSIDFDNVSSLDEYRVGMVPDGFPLIPAPAGAAELAPRLAVNMRTDDGERALDLARAAGFSAVRVDLGWSDIETVRGVYDFSRFDALLEDLSSRGMRLHLILDYLNPLYPELSAPDFESTTLSAFAAMARETAKHFRGKQVSYEIWNEPNSPTFWTRSPADFAALSKELATAIHAGDTDAPVCTGGLSGFDYRFAQDFLAVGGAEGADAMGVHPYRKGGGETIGHDLVLMRAVIEEAQGAGLPLWQTEWGYSSSWYGDGHSASARARQANLVARELLSAWAMGFPLIVYYDLRDGGSDPNNAEHNFGLLQDDYAEKPAMAAVRELTQVASNRQYVGLLQTSLSSLHALRLNGRSDLV
ncbi:MAG TPA: cellulase family glycosylhydrolase, partial [Polyangiaceae bacterium]|nr:cellulase family glycosylhydrolase [Polyangiaceae bacterium]